jgi:HD superfamily phosphodiesterase
MEALKESIREAEQTWMLPLLNHCHKIFSDVFLPSHDHLHHYRVWSYAKDLMLMLEEAGCNIPLQLPEQLILAAFFHDTGLIRTHDEKHGLESRRQCTEFFMLGEHPVPDAFPEILDAIEHHDDKTFRGQTITEEPDRLLLSLLGTSDDLDAFGYTGIYRYAEIYLLRKFNPADLPVRILGNLTHRFNNLNCLFDPLPHFVDRQKIRYWITYEFYAGLMADMAAGNERPGWRTELIDVFQDAIRRRENLLTKERCLPVLERKREVRQFFMLIDEENSFMV